MKLKMAKESSQNAWITNNNHGNIELNVNRMTATLFSKFGARLQHVTGTYHGKQRHGMNLLVAKIKSPLLTMSQKGSENMMAPT